MGKNRKLILLLTIIIALAGCDRKRVKIHKNHTYKHKHNIERAYQPRFTEVKGAYPIGGYRDQFRSSSYQAGKGQSEILKPARSMEELDLQSRSVKPTLVYSYPRSGYSRGVNFVNTLAIRNQILEKINAIRANGASCSRVSAPPVKWNNKLEDAAKAHVQDMALHHFLGHMGSGTSTDLARKSLGVGSNFYERILFFGYPVKPGELAGEIITYTKYRIVGSKNSLANFSHALDNFLRSPRHCALLMNPRFNDVGVAGYRDSDKIYWDIEFGESKYH